MPSPDADGGLAASKPLMNLNGAMQNKKWGMRGTPEQKWGVKDSLAELNAGQLSLLPNQQQVDVLKRLHAASPQFRFFTADEARAAGNVWVEESKPSDRNTFVSRRRSNLFRQIEEVMIQKKPA